MSENADGEPMAGWLLRSQSSREAVFSEADLKEAIHWDAALSRAVDLGHVVPVMISTRRADSTTAAGAEQGAYYAPLKTQPDDAPHSAGC